MCKSMVTVHRDVFLVLLVSFALLLRVNGSPMDSYQMSKGGDSEAPELHSMMYEDEFFPEDGEWFDQVHILSSRGDLRLVIGEDDTVAVNAGRLQIYLGPSYTDIGSGEVETEGNWGTVCGEGFSLAAANVACRQMGYKGATGWNYTMYSPFGTSNDSVSIAVSQVKCPASYLWHMLRCNVQFGDSENDCTHQKDVAVFCTPEKIWDTPYNGQVRLIPQANSSGVHSYGRMEVFQSGHWGSVCNKGFNQAGADSACRQLGYTGAVYSGEAYPGSGVIHVKGSHCESSQPCFTECFHAHTFIHDCNHTMDVAIQCSFDVDEAGQYSAGYSNNCAVNYFPLSMLILCVFLGLGAVILVGCMIVFVTTMTRCCYKCCTRKRKRYQELY